MFDDYPLIRIAKGILHDPRDTLEIYSAQTDWKTVTELTDDGIEGVLAITFEGDKNSTFYMQPDQITAVRHGVLEDMRDAILITDLD